jgi:predicted nucleic acid-binding protein
MSADKVFFDTNVLVYLFDRHTARKQRRAQELLTEFASSLVLSTQVLQEFYVTATRKLAQPLSAADAEQQIEYFCAFDVVSTDPALVRRGIALARTDRVSLWDALIIEAARTRDCARLMTEDLQHGRAFGRLRVENPFADL